ncbi:MAG: hypothetical protein HC874_29395 [Richelia sp. SL_2_1]|nr:hypothetical protein [Richelia sp. SL_2_1]
MNTTSKCKKHSIFHDNYQNSLIGVFSFELTSLYGRFLFNSKPKIKAHDKNLLNLGSGGTYLEGWVNADFFQLPFRPLLKKNIYRRDWELDLRFPLNCDDNVWDGILQSILLSIFIQSKDYN